MSRTTNEKKPKLNRGVAICKRLAAKDIYPYSIVPIYAITFDRIKNENPNLTSLSANSQTISDNNFSLLLI